MSGVLELLPHDMGLRVELDTNETYYLKSGWIGCCDGIYGLAVSYTDGSDIGHVFIPWQSCSHRNHEQPREAGSPI